MRWEREHEGGHIVKTHWGDKIDTEKQVFDAHYAFTVTHADGTTERVEDDLRLKYYYEEQLREYLSAAGLVIKEEYGWYDKTPIADNRELIFVCGRN